MNEALRQLKAVSHKMGRRRVINKPQARRRKQTAAGIMHRAGLICGGRRRRQLIDAEYVDVDENNSGE